MAKITFDLIAKEGTKDFAYEVEKIICVGFAGRNKQAVLDHIVELEKIGVKRPDSVPTLYPCANLLITQEDKIQVIGGENSGEIEFALLFEEDDVYVSLCSDHTDRSLETVSIEKSKQVCPKPIAKTLWKYSEVKDHWDEMVLRSWVTVKGKEELYQEGKVSSILKVEDIIDEIDKRVGKRKGLAVFSGTIATHVGLVYGENFRAELEDPVLGRKITLNYAIEVMA